MNRFIAGLGVAAVLVAAASGTSACSSSQPAQHKAKKHQAAQVYDSNGQYYTRVYDPNANDWVWYWLIFQNNQPYVGSSLPSNYGGTQWSRVASPPPASTLAPTGQFAKVDEKGDPQEEPTETEQEAQANGEETVDENTSTDEAAQAVDPDVEAPADNSGNDTGNSGGDNSGGDSSGGDSGGGDAGGGGDGGGGGGE